MRSSLARSRARPLAASGLEIFAIGEVSIHCQSRSATFSTAESDAMMRSTVAGARFLRRTVFPFKSLSRAAESTDGDNSDKRYAPISDFHQAR